MHVPVYRSDWDKRAWEDLLAKGSPSVLLSDDPDFTQGVVVQPINNLPAWMSAPMGANAWGGMYAMATAPVAMGQGRV